MKSAFNFLFQILTPNSQCFPLLPEHGKYPVHTGSNQPSQFRRCSPPGSPGVRCSTRSVTVNKKSQSKGFVLCQKEMKIQKKKKKNQALIQDWKSHVLKPQNSKQKLFFEVTSCKHMLQGPPNYDPQAKSSPPHIFINKIVLTHSHLSLFTFIDGCFIDG